MAPTRRSLLLLLAVGTIALTPWRRASACLGTIPGDGSFASSFLALFSDPRHARAIGRRYLALFPGEADPQGLKASLLLEGEDWSPGRIRLWLSEQRQSDFALGRTVLLDGWILARSEVRACALVAVLPRG